MNNGKLFEEIWTTYHPKLQVYLKQITPYSFDIENRVSEILLKVFDSYNNYNPKYALSTWIYRIARNSQVDEIRKRSVTLVDIEDYDLSEESSFEENIIREEEFKTLHKALEILERDERELVFLYYYEEKNYREISEITGIPEGTLKYRMSITRRRLKSILERRFSYER